MRLQRMRSSISSKRADFYPANATRSTTRCTNPRQLKQALNTTHMEIKVAHSPDSDDDFMFYGLATEKINTGELHFSHVLKDIQTLNHVAMTTRDYDVTAISFHAYAYIADHYVL